MSKRIEVPLWESGFGYVGQWCDGRIGWFLPEHLSPARKATYPDPPNDHAVGIIKASPSNRMERFYLCQITATPVLDKRGRPITRIVRKGDTQ